LIHLAERNRKLESGLERIFSKKLKPGKAEMLKYKVVGWWGRKNAGLKGRLTGSRANPCFQAGRYTACELELFLPQ